MVMTPAAIRELRRSPLGTDAPLSRTEGLAAPLYPETAEGPAPASRKIVKNTGRSLRDRICHFTLCCARGCSGTFVGKGALCDGLHLDSLALSVHEGSAERQTAGAHFL